jgi:hypothetical protein
MEVSIALSGFPSLLTRIISARVAFNLAFNPFTKDSIKAIAVAHPSLLKNPDDFEVSLSYSQSKRNSTNFLA